MLKQTAFFDYLDYKKQINYRYRFKIDKNRTASLKSRFENF